MVLSNDQRVKITYVYPPIYTDLSLLKLFLLVHVKNKVLQNKPQDFQRLKTNITNLITGVARATLKKVVRSVAKRGNSFVNNNGGLF